MIACGLCALAAVGAAQRPGVAAADPWSCPDSHPIKGYLAGSGRVYFVPGGVFYDEASPERCYASEDEARHDGARPVGRPAPAGPADELAISDRPAHAGGGKGA